MPSGDQASGRTRTAIRSGARAPSAPTSGTGSSGSISKTLPRPVTLAEVKANKKLANFDLVRLSRLSIMKVSDDQWDTMEGMAKQ